MQILIRILLSFCFFPIIFGQRAVFFGENVASSTPFDPTQLTGIKFDYRANFGNNCGGGACTNNANQDSWTDKSSNANNLSYSGSPCGANAVPAIYHTARTPASTPAVTFGSSTPGSDCMKFTTTVNMTGGSASICAVTSLATAGLSSGTNQIVYGSNAFAFNQARGGTKLQGADKGGAAVLGAGNAAAATGWHLICATYDDTTLKFYLDGASDGNVTVSNTITGNETVVGALGNFSEGFVGDIAEIFGTTSILNAGDITNIHNWSVAQYGTP